MTPPRPSPLCLAAMLFLGSGVASATTITAIDDTYVRRDNAGPFGAEPQLVLKNRGDGDTTRKAVVRFRQGTVTDPLDASLSLDVSTFSGGTSATFYIFGVTNYHLSGVECSSMFLEEYLKYRDLPFLDDSDDGVKNSSTCIFEGNALGTITVKATDVGKTVTFTSPALLRFLKQNSTYLGIGNQTFVITRKETSGDLSTAFASKEHGTLKGPRLTWTERDGIVFDDTSSAPVPTTTTTQRYVGTLKLPLAGGKYITVPGADVEMTYSGGRLQTINGTVAMPELPQSGIFEHFSLSGPRLSIGYDYPSAFSRYVDVPLETNQRYFYLLAITELGIEIEGLFTLSAPYQGTSFIAIDPVSSTFFGYTNQIPFGELPIEAVSVGFSDGDKLTYSPLVNKGVESQMAVMTNGNVYLGGELGFSSEKYKTPYVEFGATVTGAMTAKVVPADFANKSFDWLRKMGVNGSLDLSATLGDFVGISMNVANGSLVYQRYAGIENKPRFAFAGETGSPILPMAVDFGFSGPVRVAGVVDLNFDGMGSYLLMTGLLGLGSNSKQPINGSVTIGAHGAGFEGSAKFAGFSIQIEGEITPSSYTFTGKKGIDWKWQGYDMEGTVKAEYSSARTSGVKLTGDLKACVDPDIGSKTCTPATNVDFNVTNDGHVKVCFKVFGTSACETL